MNNWKNVCPNMQQGFWVKLIFFPSKQHIFSLKIFCFTQTTLNRGTKELRIYLIRIYICVSCNMVMSFSFLSYSYICVVYQTYIYISNRDCETHIHICVVYRICTYQLQLYNMIYVIFDYLTCTELAFLTHYTPSSWKECIISSLYSHDIVS